MVSLCTAAVSLFTATHLRAMMNMRMVAQASLAIARATALTPSLSATFASTFHPEKQTCMCHTCNMKEPSKGKWTVNNFIG